MKQLAAIDIGTNTIKLLVASVEEDGSLQILSREKALVRLGSETLTTGRLSEEAIEAGVAAVEQFLRSVRAAGAELVRTVATCAVREASNSGEFLEAVRRRTGVTVDVVSGEEEARLINLGVRSEYPARFDPLFLIDIGGGSTEFVIGSAPGRAEHALSTQMGSVRLTERFVRSDPPTREELAALALAVDDALDQAEAHLPIGDAHTFVSVSGSATTLQAIALGLPRYDPEAIHRTWLTRTDAERVTDDLARMTDAERAALPVMAPGRGDVIVAGAMVLTNVMRRFGFERTLVSETDILDGLAFELLDIR